MTETEKIKKSSCGVGEGEILILIDKSKCSGCGLCGEICPFGLPNPDGSGKFEIERHDLCTECSACQRNCPEQAIKMNEVEGCGCLWDARQRKKAEKSGKAYIAGCCASGSTPSSSCCPPAGAPPSIDINDFSIEFVDKD